MSFMDDLPLLLQTFGNAMVGSRNIGQGIGQGAVALTQRQQYQNMLGKLFQQANPGNPVGTGTPTNNFVTADRSGMQPITQPTPGGMMSGPGSDQIKQLLGSMTPDQGSPILGSLLMARLSPHGFDVVQESDGPHKIDKITGEDMGRLGGPKLQEFDPTKTYAVASDGGGTPMPTLPGPAAGSGAANLTAPKAEEVAPILQKSIPGLVVTGMGRTPAQNRAVNGVANSAHLLDHALDIRATPGLTVQALQQQADALGLPNAKVIYEGPGAKNSTGPHFHMQWGDGAPAQPAGTQPASSPLPGYNVVYQGRPPERPMTPAELKSYNAFPGSTINTVTGAVSRATQFNSPMDQGDPQIKLLGGMIAQGMPIPTRNPALFKAAIGAAQQILADQGVPADQIAARIAKANQDFKGAQAAVTNFDQGKLGNQTRSFSVALSHLDTLGKLAGALNNGDTQSINALANVFKTQFGRPAPTSFNAARDIVADEIVKAIVGSGGGVGDRENARATVNAAQSPAQLAGVINTYKTLMAGQLKGLAQQYTVATGRNDFNSRLSPEAQALLNPPSPPAAGAGGWSNFRVH